MQDLSKPSTEVHASEGPPGKPERPREPPRIDLPKLLGRLEQTAEEHRRSSAKLI